MRYKNIKNQLEPLTSSYTKEVVKEVIEEISEAHFIGDCVEKNFISDSRFYDDLAYMCTFEHMKVKVACELGFLPPKFGSMQIHETELKYEENKPPFEGSLDDALDVLMTEEHKIETHYGVSLDKIVLHIYPFLKRGAKISSFCEI